MTKNALVYIVNDSPLYLDCVVNSINSFYANNPQWLLDQTSVFIITDCEDIDKKIGRLLYENVKYSVIADLSYDYASVKINTKMESLKRFGIVSLWKHEILHNPIFRDFDNVLFLDSDTTIEKPIDELFTDERIPGIYMVYEIFSEVKVGYLREQNLPLFDISPNSGVILLHQPKEIGGDVLDGLFNYLLKQNEEHIMQFIAQDDYYLAVNDSGFSSLFHELATCYNHNKYAKNFRNSNCKICHHVCAQGNYNKTYINFVLPENRTDVPSIYSICKKKIPLLLYQGISSECPLGNATIIPYKNNNMYLCGAKEFIYSMYENYNSSSAPQRNRYKNLYKRTSQVGYHFVLLNNSFLPYPKKFQEVVVPRLSNRDNVIEDGRLFWWDEKLYLFASEVNTKNSMSQTASLFSVEDNNWRITLNLLYNSDEMFSGRQKNWMPIPDKPFKMVFSVDEHSTSILDLNTRTIEHIPHKINVCPNELRGNTPLFKVGDKYITIVHTANNKEYYHYMCVFDQNLSLEHISRRFVFDKFFPVEFAINMFQQNRTNNIGITVTEMDSFQYVYLVNKDRLMEFIYS